MALKAYQVATGVCYCGHAPWQYEDNEKSWNREVDSVNAEVEMTAKQ